MDYTKGDHWGKWKEGGQSLMVTQIELLENNGDYVHCACETAPAVLLYVSLSTA